MQQEVIIVKREQKTRLEEIFVILFLVLSFCSIPIAMIVIGSSSENVVCRSPCLSYECKPKDADYNIDTPPIGISASLWLIVGGVNGIVFVLAFATMRKLSLGFILVYLFTLAWLIVGAVVYAQISYLCRNYNMIWFVAGEKFKWLLAMVIAGFVGVVGPLFLGFFCGVCGKKEFPQTTVSLV